MVSLGQPATHGVFKLLFSVCTTACSHLCKDDDEDVEMEDVSKSEDLAGGGLRLEDIVRHHRRRCAIRAVDVSSESSKHGGAIKLRAPETHVQDEERGLRMGASSLSSDELAAMAAAADALADPAIVGRLFDTLLPPIGNVPSVSSAPSSSSSSAHGSKESPASIPAWPTKDADADAYAYSAYSPFVADKEGGGPGDEDDPVIALCSLYADLVMDGVRAGPGVSAGSAGSAAAGRGGMDSTSVTQPTTPGRSVLNALAFGRPQSPIAARLWAFLQGRRALKALTEGEDPSGGSKALGTGRVQSALFLFCSAYR